MQGTSSDQDNRFADKQKKLLKQMKFGESLEKKFLLPSSLSLYLVCHLHILCVTVIEMECVSDVGAIPLDGVGFLQGIALSQDGNESSLLPFDVSGDFTRCPLIEGLEFNQSPPSLASQKVESFNSSLRMVNMSKVKLDVIKPWIAHRITELLGGVEDDVVVEFVFNQLEADKAYVINSASAIGDLIGTMPLKKSA
ncbi:unnamed protein product, partial [Darwinula stevensoni]